MKNKIIFVEIIVVLFNLSLEPVTTAKKQSLKTKIKHNNPEEIIMNTLKPVLGEITCALKLDLSLNDRSEKFEFVEISRLQVDDRVNIYPLDSRFAKSDFIFEATTYLISMFQRKWTSQQL